VDNGKNELSLKYTDACTMHAHYNKRGLHYHIHYLHCKLEDDLTRTAVAIMGK